MMNVKEKAQIAFHHIANGEPWKAEAIQNTVEAKDYRLGDLEFSSPLSCCILFASIWSTEYWKNMALQQTDKAKYFFDVLQGNPVPTSVELEARLASFEGRALAIDEALVTICQVYGIYPDDVRKMAANAVAYKPVGKNAKADTAYKAQLIEHFTSMMASWPGNALQKGNGGACVH